MKSRFFFPRTSMDILYLIIITTTFVNDVLTLFIAEDCATPDSKQGICVDTNTCSKIKSLLEKPDLSEEEVKYLQWSKCGNTSKKVCCQVSNKSVPFVPPVEPENPIKLEFRQNDDDEYLLPELDHCGNQNYFDDRIIGVVAGIDEFPWMALLKYQYDQERGYACGGALISKRYVLTAAHCVSGKFGAPIEVTLGEYDINTEKDCDFSLSEEGDCAEPVQNMGIEKIMSHPEYIRNDSRKLNDIALIRLSKPVVYTDYVQPICLPTQILQNKIAAPSKILQVAGWGKTEDGVASNLKRKARVPVVDRITCSKNKLYKISETQICAGGGKEDSCNGDSGGPLMSSDWNVNGEAKYYVTGIVSFGPKECATKAGVYTNVASYTTWIKNNIVP